jgi:hypothetical protein
MALAIRKRSGAYIAALFPSLKGIQIAKLGWEPRS